MDFDGDVLIAGGGPTGMTAALALAEAGQRVVIVDKHPHGLDFSRAILVNSSTLASLARFGVADRIAARGRPLRSLRLCGPSGPLVSGRLDEAEAHGPQPILLPQLETEACLREALAARGVTVERPCALVGFTQDGEGVSATLATPGGRRTLRAKWLIGADGHHSRVREGLGLNYRTLGRDATMYSADVVMDAPFAEDVCVWLLGVGAGVAMRIGERKLRLAGTSRAVFDTLGFSTRIEATTWEVDFVASFALAERYGEGRVWLAGDAAHVHSPVGGRGMNMGIADGLRLARAILEGDGAAYARERRPVAEAWVATNHRMTQTISWPGMAGRLLRLGLGEALHLAALATGERAGRFLFDRMTRA